MHDPCTQAFYIRIPLPWKRDGLLKSSPREWATYHLATIWHKDPERGPGGDDSCGWFMRAHHGNQEVLAKIIKRFDEDWDRVYTTKKEDHGPDDGKLVPRTYYFGYFHPQDSGAGMPNMSVSAIVLNLFFLAANEHFNSNGLTNWRKTRRWMQKNLFDILLFAENPTDSLRDSIVRKWGTDTSREERIRSMAATIYGWILRETRPWYRHPRWHVHHWRLQVPFLQECRRFLFSRCSKCGHGFAWGESVYGSWGGNEIWHERCANAKPCKPASEIPPQNLTAQRL